MFIVVFLFAFSLSTKWGLGGGGGGRERLSVLITSYSFSCSLQEWCYHGQWGVKTPVYNFSSSLFVSVDLKNVSVCVCCPPPPPPPTRSVRLLLVWSYKCVFTVKCS